MFYPARSLFIVHPIIICKERHHCKLKSNKPVWLSTLPLPTVCECSRVSFKTEQTNKSESLKQQPSPLGKWFSIVSNWMMKKRGKDQTHFTKKMCIFLFHLFTYFVFVEKKKLCRERFLPTEILLHLLLHSSLPCFTVFNSLLSLTIVQQIQNENTGEPVNLKEKCSTLAEKPKTLFRFYRGSWD